MRAHRIARSGPDDDGSRVGCLRSASDPGERRNHDKLALAILLDLIDHPDNWTVGLAVIEIEARGYRAPPCKPATDHVAPVMTMH